MMKIEGELGKLSGTSIVSSARTLPHHRNLSEKEVCSSSLNGDSQINYKLYHKFKSSYFSAKIIISEPNTASSEATLS